MTRYWYMPADECRALAAPPRTQGVTTAERRGDVAVIAVRGALAHHEGGPFDSYDAIRGRVGDALSAGAKALVLRLDSPGGDVSGCFEAAASIKAACETAKVPLYAYVDGRATSAAYALACVASRIVAPVTGIVGSIGTIAEMVETTALDAAMGLRFQLVASGERKTDGNPHAPITEGAVLAVQSTVDRLSEVFFAHVAAHRPITVDEVRALRAGVLVGADAESRGLVDEVASFDALIARISAGASTVPAPAGAASTEESDVDEEKKARAALKAIVDGDGDEKAKARAKAALAAMDAPDDEEDEKAKAEKAKAAKAEDEPAPEKKDGEGEDAKAIAAKAVEMVLADRRERKVSALLGARPDLTAEQRAAFAALSPDDLEKVLAATPVKAKKNPAATVVVPATRGATQGIGIASRQTPAEAAMMDAAMGLRPTKLGIIDRGDTLILGAPIAATDES